ncbi:hypothetical protein XBJ2_130115 [Xenorhabdus bovienii str. Jollieti]|uniref:Uncharacterized protein n=1 Tax=Xenorhabdus bovienii (strain SS-2004) TaxID=406818 RepID=D3UZ47_XENBS|nr:hypothetical protein XBJ1_0425 [Xenorhabdus bovienii SS-2004]CDH27441.1 hypothetical protein XBJ2_130115 [Xenorhabdus bovienii str. Jollieti]
MKKTKNYYREVSTHPFDMEKISLTKFLNKHIEDDSFYLFKFCLKIIFNKMLNYIFK